MTATSATQNESAHRLKLCLARNMPNARRAGSTEGSALQLLEYFTSMLDSILGTMAATGSAYVSAAPWHSYDKWTIVHYTLQIRRHGWAIAMRMLFLTDWRCSSSTPLQSLHFASCRWLFRDQSTAINTNILSANGHTRTRDSRFE